jgi:hypothetical protein
LARFKLFAIICIVCLVSIGALFVWITKDPFGLTEMKLSIAGCASTHHKLSGAWPQNYPQLEKSCDATERRIISQIKTLYGLHVYTRPIADGVRIMITGQYRGEYRDECEIHFSNYSMRIEQK